MDAAPPPDQSRAGTHQEQGGRLRHRGAPFNPPLSFSRFQYAYVTYNPRTGGDNYFLAYEGVVSPAEEQSPIPEPTTGILVVTALMGAWYRKRRTSVSQR